MPEADEGDSLRPLTPLTKIIILWLPALKPPPLTVVAVVVAVEVVVEDVVEEVTFNGALALECDLRTTSNANKGKGKRGRKMGSAYFNQGKGSCLKGDRCGFSHDPNVEVAPFPKGKGKGKRGGSNSPRRSASPAGRDTPPGGSSPRGSSSGRPVDPTKYKTKPCDNFARGTCTLGDRFV